MFCGITVLKIFKRFRGKNIFFDKLIKSQIYSLQLHWNEILRNQFHIIFGIFKTASIRSTSRRLLLQNVKNITFDLVLLCAPSNMIVPNALTSTLILYVLFPTTFFFVLRCFLTHSTFLRSISFEPTSILKYRFQWLFHCLPDAIPTSESERELSEFL